MIPWDWKKQSFGSEIEIIGHWIDCDAMTISLSDEKRVALAEELADFAKPPSHPLIRWTRMTGWANWGINIFPLGCWALQSSWDKMAGKTLRNAHVPPNTMTRSDQQWLSDALFKWKGKQLLDSMFWTLDSADATLLCDACPTGLGIWVPKTNKGYTLRLPPPSRDIYWAELAAVTYVIMIAHDDKARHIVIFTDSHNVVDLFNSHRANNTVRVLFKKSIDLMLTNDLDVKVKHIPGERNVIADSLSRNNLNLAKDKLANLEISELPPMPTELNGGFRKTHCKA